MGANMQKKRANLTFEFNILAYVLNICFPGMEIKRKSYILRHLLNEVNVANGGVHLRSLTLLMLCTKLDMHNHTTVKNSYSLYQTT